MELKDCFRCKKIKFAKTHSIERIVSPAKTIALAVHVIKERQIELKTSSLVTRRTIGIHYRIVAPVESIPLVINRRRSRTKQILICVRSGCRYHEALIGTRAVIPVDATVRRPPRAPVVMYHIHSPAGRNVVLLAARGGGPPVGVRAAVRAGPLEGAIPEEYAERVAVTRARRVSRSLPTRVAASDADAAVEAVM